VRNSDGAGAGETTRAKEKQVSADNKCACCYACEGGNSCAHLDLELKFLTFVP